jgi:hypothetical protein
MTQYALGRIVHHDPRSLDYPAATAAHKPVSWRHYGAVLDQGNLGSCTGNAAAQALNSAPLHKPRRIFRETDAVSFYSEATRLDPYPGEYPPTDTGASGLAVAKALKNRGLITGYTHAFGLDHALGALQNGPLLVGTEWTQDMFTPDSAGYVHPTGATAGGHEYLLLADDGKNKLTFLNSWSASWGIKGFFHMTYADFATLLDNQGDVTALNSNPNQGA